MRALFVQTPASLIGYLIGWSLMVAMYWPLAPRGPMLAWSGVLAALLLVRLAHYLRFRRNPDADDATLHEWRRSWKLLVLAQASTWAVAVWLFWDLGTPYHRTALMLAIFSLGLASVQLLATQQRLYIAFVGLLMVPAPSCASPPTPASRGTGSWPASWCCSSSRCWSWVGCSAARSTR